MKKNMGFADRIIRVMMAVVFVALYWMGIINGVWAIILIALAFVFVVTSLISFCPLYLPFGLNTLHKKIYAKNNNN